MPDIHAVLSPSSSARWLACTPSARLCAAKEDKTSEYAIQGTSAHALAEYKLKKSLGQPIEDPTENPRGSSSCNHLTRDIPGSPGNA